MCAQDRPPFSNWDVSPDGSAIALVHNDNNQLRILDLGTKQERSIRVDGWHGFEHVAWAADGKALYLNGSSPKKVGYAALLRVDLLGHVSVLRQKEYEWHASPVPSRDGRRLAFAVMPFHGNVWVLENF